MTITASIKTYCQKKVNDLIAHVDEVAEMENTAKKNDPVCGAIVRLNIII